MTLTKNTKFFCEKLYHKDDNQLRSATQQPDHRPPGNPKWNENTVPLVPDSCRPQSIYRGHGGLHPQQKFLIFLTKIHRNIPNDFLADRWLNCSCKMMWSHVSTSYQECCFIVDSCDECNYEGWEILYEPGCSWDR